MKEERRVFIQAYINLVASEKDPSKINTDVADLQNTLKSLDDSYFRDVIVWSFTDNNNICNKYKLSTDTCTKIFSKLVSNPTLKEEFWFSYYALKDYQRSFQLSEKSLLQVMIVK